MGVPGHASTATRLRRTVLVLLLGYCIGGSPTPAGAAALQPRQQVAQHACDALAEHVGAASGPPIFLASYPDENHGDPALAAAAFTYDNALAAIALIACKRLPQAQRVGAALRDAALTGPRLRNAYRAGPVKGAVLPNGWWDAKANRWQEDPHQFGTATGNVAWAGLALLALDAATGERQWRDAASHLARWIVANTASDSGAPGFTGGLDGFDDHPEKLAWKSTEHNIDAAALFAWLARDDKSGAWQQPARDAHRFVASQWDTGQGYFQVGTLPDGHENTGASALDVQMWAQLLPRADPQWRRAVRRAEANYAVAGGFDFNTDRDGLWLEGTAQAALVYQTLGENAKASALFATLSRQFAADGYVFATREARITTGLALGPNSPTADFYSFHRPHLGATAWAALAALDWNPFVAHAR
jgi:hypothetical protein